MTANGTNNTAAILAELTVEIRYIRAQIDALTKRFDDAEKERQERSQAYQQQVNDLRSTAALNVRRIDELEKSHCALEDELRQMAKVVERLSATVGFVTAIGGGIGSLIIGWLVAQFLGLI